MTLLKIKEMTYFKHIDLVELISEIKEGQRIGVFGNLREIGPYNSGLLIYNLTKKEQAYYSIVFLDRKVSLVKYAYVTMELIGDHYGIPVCHLLSIKPFEVNIGKIREEVMEMLPQYLGSEIDISDIVTHHLNAIKKRRYKVEEIMSNLSSEDTVIDYTGKVLLLIERSIPVSAGSLPIFRYLYLLVKWSIFEERIMDVILTIMGHVEE